MVRVERAKRHQLSAVNNILTPYGYEPINESYINHRDIALVALDESKIVGFIWAGLMAQNKFGYLDYFAVHPEYFKNGVGNKLSIAIVKALHQNNVTRLVGLIVRGKYHDTSAINALKVGMAAYPLPATVVFGNIDKMIQESRVL